MIRLTTPTELNPEDMRLRTLVDRRAFGLPLEDPPPPRPEGFPSISLIMLAKNEWLTLERAVDSCLGIVDEVIIGVDKLTDTPLAFAYELCFEKKQPREAQAFFDEILCEKRYARIDEIAGFLEMDVKELSDYCDKKFAETPTMAAAERAVAKAGAGEVFSMDFKNHFSQARNQTVEKAKGEWVMFVDAHEYFRNADRLLEWFPKVLKEQPDLATMSVTLDEIDSPIRQTIQQVRIIKKTPQFHFERGVHNKPVLPDVDKENPEHFANLSFIELVHDRPAWLSAFRDPQRQVMTEDHMSEDAGTASAHLYFLGLGAHRRKEFPAALEYYNQYLEMVGDCPESGIIAASKGKLYQYDADPPDFEKAADAYWDATRRCPQAAWAFLSLAALALLASEKKEKEHEKELKLREALALAQLADGCELPVSTMCVPSTPFTWETPLRMADIYARLEMYGNMLECLMRCQTFEMPPSTTEMVDRMVIEAKGALSLEMSAEKRISIQVPGKKVLIVIDAFNQFSKDIRDVAREMGYEVKAYRQFDPALAYEGDVWWVDWADEAAMTASRMVRDDRKLIVRCHSFETFGPIPGEIDWDEVDVPLAAAPNTLQKLGDAYGLDKSRFNLLTVYPNPDDFPILTEEKEDVVFLGRINSKKGVTRLPDLAELLPERMIHVGGTLQDERLFDEAVEMCLARGISNLNFHGHISEFERNRFMTLGRHYVCLSPWETLSVALWEAQICGLACHTLSYDWVQYVESVSRNDDLRQMAESIRYWDEKPIPDRRPRLTDQYNKMKEKIREILTF